MFIVVCIVVFFFILKIITIMIINYCVYDIDIICVFSRNYFYNLKINMNSMRTGGIDDDNRNSCTVYDDSDKNMTYVFHTHPENELSFPSREDIMVMIDSNNNIYLSLIATKWGIWIINKNEE